MNRFDYSKISRMSLEDIYHYANEAYWEGTLPDVNVEWSDQMRTKLGLAIPANVRDQDSHAIRLSSLLRNDPQKLLNVMVHEQIHIWQFAQFELTRDPTYLDRKNLSRSLGHRKGHGAIFHAQAHRLQTQFPELEISVADDFDAKVSGVDKADRYGAVLSVRDRHGRRHQALFWSDTDFHSEISLLCEGALEVYGVSLVEGVTPFITKNMNVEKAVKIKKSGELRKGQANVIHKDEFVQDILSDEETIIDWNRSVDLKSCAPEVDTRVADLVPALVPHRGGPLASYVLLAINNAKIPPLTGSQGNSPGAIRLDMAGAEKAVSGRHPDVDANLIAFLEGEWRKAKPSDFFRKSMPLKLLADKAAERISRCAADVESFREDSIRLWREVGGESRLGWKTFTKKLSAEIDRGIRRRAKSNYRDPAEIANAQRMLEEKLAGAPARFSASEAIASDRYYYSQLPEEEFINKSLSNLRSMGLSEHDRERMFAEIKSAWNSVSLTTSFADTCQGANIGGAIYSLYQDSVDGRPMRPLGRAMYDLLHHIDEFRGRQNYTTREAAFSLIRPTLESLVIESDPGASRVTVKDFLDRIQMEWAQAIEEEKRFESSDESFEELTRGI